MVLCVCCRLSGRTGSRTRDGLGGCAYKTVREFYTSHRDADPMNQDCSAMRAARGSNVAICHYFPDMVSEAIADARRNLADVPRIRAA